jgi:GAG-pre-integrase domain
MATNPHSSSAPTQFTHQLSTILGLENYLVWKSQVLLVLRGHGLTSFIDGSTIPPSATITSSDGNCSKPNHTAKTYRWKYQSDNNSPQAYVAQPNFNPCSTSPNWVIDSGASHHVTGDFNNLSSFYAYPGSNTLQISNSISFPIQSFGSSSLSLNSTTLHLNEVLVVPHFTKNLISLSRLLLDNPYLTIEFSFNTCIFKDLHTKNQIHRLSSSNGLFTISLGLSPPPQAYVGSRVFADIWHARFGHASSTTTSSIIKSFSLSCNAQKQYICHDCSVAKSHKLLFNLLCQFLSHHSTCGGHPRSYPIMIFVTIFFMDDFSHFSLIYFLHNKSEVPRFFLFSNLKSKICFLHQSKP